MKNHKKFSFCLITTPDMEKTTFQVFEKQLDKMLTIKTFRKTNAPKIHHFGGTILKTELKSFCPL